MTTDITISPDASPQAIAARGRSGKLTVTGKLKTALDAMVWSGARRSEAAETAGITDHSLRSALNKPHVKAYYLGQLQVLRESERARNVLRLAEIRDASNNMPAVQAIGMLERMSEETTTRSAGSVSLPGIVIQIVNASSLPAQQGTLPTQGQSSTSQVIDNNED